MALQTIKHQSIFPDFPRNSPITDNNGKLTAAWHLSLASLYQALQRNLSNEGWTIPSLKLSEINTIEAIYNPLLLGKKLSSTNPATPNISGQIVYDSTNSVPKMFIIEFSTPGDQSSTISTASWKTFTLT